MNVLVRSHEDHITKFMFILLFWFDIQHLFVDCFFKLQVTEILAEQASINKDWVTWFPLFNFAHTLEFKLYQWHLKS